MTEKIDDEAELVEALEKSGIGEKLVPQSLNYGYHFWFDMENQKIEVLDLKKVKTPTRDIPPANTSFRDLYDKGLFLIDYTILSEMFSTADITHNVFSYIDDLAVADQYANLISKLGEVTEDHLYYDIAVDILAKVHNTTIRTEAGAFFENGATKEYTSASANFLGDGFYNYDNGKVTSVDSSKVPVPSGTIQIPSNIEYVSEGALHYPENSGVVIVMPSIDRIVDSFSPDASNATIQVDDKTYMIGDSDGNNTDKLYTTDGVYVADLITKLPFEDFVIRYEDEGKIAYLGDTDRIYVAYRNGKLQLNAANAADTTQTSNKVKEWSVIPGEYGSFSIGKNTGIIDLTGATFVNNICEVTVQAKTLNVNAEECIKTIKVVVVKPISAEVKITALGSNPSIVLSENGTSSIAQLEFNGELTSYAAVVEAIYSTDSLNTNIQSVLGLSPVISVANEATSPFITNATGDKLVFRAADANGDNEYDEGAYTFVMHADGCLATTVTANMKDASKAVFGVNYHHVRSADRGYYVGSANGVKLSDLFNVGNRFTSGMTATLNIYDRVGGTGKLYPFYLANNDPEEDEKFNLTTKIDGTEHDSITLTPGAWENLVLQFIYEDVNDNASGDNTLDAYVEIIPSDGSVSTVIKFEIVDDAVNVTDINSLKPKDGDGKVTSNAIVFDTNVVLQDDCDVGTGTTIDIGENKTLYGNGYKINATTYVASGKVGSGTMTTWKYECQGAQSGTANKILHALTHNVMKNNSCKMEYKDTTSNCDYYDTDAYMIKLDGGTIDNIYINGPVYPTLQYHKVVNEYNGKNVANTPYYVSGIKASAGSNILNSYVFGFRQAVEVNAAGGSVAFDNSTIEGGSYANIHWIDGNMSFNDVTTVQNSTGYTATVNGSNKVVGMGVAMDADALDNKVTITGYLNQYNWVSKESGDLLPVIDGINLGEIFDYVFDGILGRKMGSVYFFVHEATDGKEYVNAGFVFIEVGKIEDIAHYADSGVIKNSLFDDTARESGGSYAERKLSKGELSKLSSLAFNTEILGKSVGIDPAKHITGKDAKIGLLTYRDGRNWTVQDNGLMGELVEITTDAEKANVIKLGNVGYEINYTGYYTDYGN